MFLTTRIQDLTFQMVKRDRKDPKIRARGAAAGVSFGILLATHHSVVLRHTVQGRTTWSRPFSTSSRASLKRPTGEHRQVLSPILQAVWEDRPLFGRIEPEMHIALELGENPSKEEIGNPLGSGLTRTRPLGAETRFKSLEVLVVCYCLCLESEKFFLQTHGLQVLHQVSTALQQ